jgi:hypothetical protein
VNLGTRRLAISAIAIAVLGYAAGCTDDSPDRTQPPTAGPADTLTPTSPVQVPAEPVPDCAEVVSLIPAAVSADVGVESGSPDPQTSPRPDGYVTTCVLVGRSAADPRLRLFLQVRIERPRTDPYQLTPLASWFDTAAKGFAGVNCSPAGSWSGLDNGYRCETANGANVTLYLAGKAKGALVGLQTNVSPLAGQTGVTADAVRAVTTTSGERIMTALTGSL